MITAENLCSIYGCSADTAAAWVDDINITLGIYNIDTPLRASAFLAQIGHESNRLKAVEENLNYGAAGLKATFGKYFKENGLVDSYARKPQMIANRVYANRNGNGDEQSGDGWRYHGRGLIQITFKTNYESCGRALGVDFVSNPTLLADPKYATLSAGWFWDSRNLNEYADNEDFLTITKRINGGINGIEDRTKLYEKAKEVLCGSD